MSREALWGWISQNRETLALLGGGVTTGISGIWAVWRHLRDPKSQGTTKNLIRFGDGTTINVGQYPRAVFGIVAITILSLAYIAANNRAEISRSAAGGLNGLITEIPMPKPVGENPGFRVEFGGADGNNTVTNGTIR